MEMKRCSRCGQEKDYELFHKDKNNNDGFTNACKECRNTYYINYYKKNPEKQKIKNELQKQNRKEYYDSETGVKSSRKAHLKRMYGITLQEYENMLLTQNKTCKICGKTEMNNKNKVLCVDHNHVTGEIRGLLCGLCNSGLGKFLENKELLNNAIKYLTEYEKI